MNVPPQQPPPVLPFELPPAEAAPPPQRHLGGWVALALILAFLTLNQFFKYMDRDKEKGDERFLEQFSQLRRAVAWKESGIFADAFKPTAEATLQSTALDLKADSEKNEVAARLYAATLSEMGKPVPPKVLDLLRKGGEEPRDPDFAEVFGSKQLSKEQAASVRERLKGGGYISKLARAVAYEKSGQPEMRHRLLVNNGAFYAILVGLGGCFAALVGVFLWLVYIVNRVQGRWKPLGLPLEEIDVSMADRLAIRCAQIFALFLLLPLGIGFVIGHLKPALNLSDAVLSNVTNLIAYFILVAATLLLFRTRIGGVRIALADIGLHARDLGKNVAWGFCTALANIPIVIVMGMLGSVLFSWLPKAEHPVTIELQTQTDLFTTITLILVASVGAPILEEIMFRGTLLPALAKVLRRPVAAILVQGLLFAIIHPTGIPAWLALASIGAMSGFLSRQTGSLVPSIVMHGVHNFGTLILAKAFLGG